MLIFARIDYKDMANQSMLEGVQISTNAGVARIHFAHGKQNAFPATHLKALTRGF